MDHKNTASYPLNNLQECFIIHICWTSTSHNKHLSLQFLFSAQIMVSSTLLRFIYPPPESVFLTAMSMVSIVSLVIAGLMEISGSSMMHYSKIFNTSKKNVKSKMIEFSGRNGMLLAYFPAFVAAVAALALMQNQGLRFTLLTSAVALHFFKRVFEVCNDSLPLFCNRVFNLGRITFCV